MKILAIHVEKTSGCALFINDKIVYATSEERFTRIKSDSSFPLQSIKNALKHSKIKPNELDKVILTSNWLTLIPSLTNHYSNLDVKDHLKMMRDFWYPNLNQGKKLSFLKYLEHKINVNNFPFNTTLGKKTNFFSLVHPKTPETARKCSEFFKKIISDLFKINESKIIQMDHHELHAAYALYGSPIRDDKTLIVTADAYGDNNSASVSMYNKKKNKIIKLKEYHHTNFQLARIYRFTTLYLRMLPNEHEAKVMGLASYYNGPKTDEIEKIFDKILKVEKIEFIHNKKVKNIFNFLEKELDAYRFDHIAAGLQKFTEKILKTWIENLIKKHKCSSVVYSGGISMNIKANAAISEINKVKKLFICGAGTDETLHIGACYKFAELNNIKSKPLDNLYLGDVANYTKIKKNKNFDIKKFKKTDQIVDLLLKNKIVAVCRGRMEMGQRALGNRSILADPRNETNVEKINRLIKQRDFWMPFAPIILYEYQNKLIYNKKKIDSPHMTITYQTRNGRRIIPAAIHRADETTRAQLLRREQNPELWDVIYKFYKKTGIPALLNTSFNLHGFPIVRSTDDAIKVFNNSELDAVWFERDIIVRK